LQWYYFPIDQGAEPYRSELKTELLLNKPPHFNDEKTAKEHAIALGLNSWRHVKLNIGIIKSDEYQVLTHSFNVKEIDYPP
jgi:hypothetical protein